MTTSQLPLAPRTEPASAGIAVRRAPVARARAADDALGFGRVFTDHVFHADWAPGEGWHDARIEPYGPLALDPAAAALHYAQSIFEGLKAFRGPDGRVRVFRLLDHCRRFARSAEGLVMPPYAPEALAAAITTLVGVDLDWVPGSPGTALYIRPLMLATEAFLGVRPAERFATMVLLSPVGPYYGGGGLRAVRLWVEGRRVRAAQGGIGAVKAAANYAASLQAGLDAKRRGYDQVLWLDAVAHRHLEEAGTMNAFAVLGDEVVTPPLGGTILPGLTRDSVLALLRRWGARVSERQLSVDELRAAHAAGTLREVFGTGTAAVIAPVGTLGFEDGDLTVADGQPGPVARRLYEAITAIQAGVADDPDGWMTEIG